MKDTDWHGVRGVNAELIREINSLKRELAEARAERDRFIRALITMRKALVLNGSRLTDDAINAYEELKLSVANINEEDDDDSPYCECGNEPMEDESASNKCDACGRPLI